MNLSLFGPLALRRTSSADNWDTSVFGISLFMSTVATRLKLIFEVNRWRSRFLLSDVRFDLLIYISRLSPTRKKILLINTAILEVIYILFKSSR